MVGRKNLARASLATLLAGTPQVAFAAAGDRSATNAAPSDNAYLTAGIRLYEALEFTAALETFRKAEKFSSRPDEDVLIHTYEGVIQANLGTPDQAIPDFRVALSLDPHAQVLSGTSPKIRAVWEQVRREVVGRPDVPAAQADPASSAPPLVPTDPAAAPTVTEAARPNSAPRVTIPELALGGGGILFIGIGAVLGVVAHSTGTQAMTDPFQDNAASDQHSASQQQVAADVLIGVGLTALIGAGVLFAHSEWARRQTDDGARPATP